MIKLHKCTCSDLCCRLWTFRKLEIAGLKATLTQHRSVKSKLCIICCSGGQRRHQASFSLCVAHTNSVLNLKFGLTTQKPQNENWNSCESWASQRLVWNRIWAVLKIPHVSQHGAHEKKYGLNVVNDRWWSDELLSQQLCDSARHREHLALFCFLKCQSVSQKRADLTKLS